MTHPNPNRVSVSLTSSDLTGRQLGDLQILRRLGRGGMADVYVANQLTLGRRVALKVLRPDLARDASYVERFRREARAAAKLAHPNIVQIYEVGCADTLHYISQEYVDGLNLRQQLDRTGPLSPDQAVVVMQSVADALTAAAAEGVTHRDIKPENVMVNQRGEVKVADFGLARVTQGEHQNELTQVGMTMGTPLYMSPEQVQGADVDVRSDLYSLGVTMYHLLVGRPPFEADTPLALAVKHLHEDPVPINQARPVHDLPQWLCAAIERLMRKSPADRFQSPAEFRNFIQHGMHATGPIGDGTATLATRIDATRTLQRLMSEEAARRTPWLAIFAAMMLPIAGFALGLWAGQMDAPRTVADLLRPSSIAVPTRDSAAAQYLEAARLNEPEAWLKVIESFPPEASPINAAYATKSRIQLGRLYRQREQYHESEAQLRQVLAESTLANHYRAIALAELLKTQEAAGKMNDASETRNRLRQSYQSLQLTPDKLQLFNRLYSDFVHTLQTS